MKSRASDRQIKINSLLYINPETLQRQLEQVLAEGNAPVLLHFDRDAHLEVTLAVALRHGLTMVLNPLQMECELIKRL